MCNFFNRKLKFCFVWLRYGFFFRVFFLFWYDLNIRVKKCKWESVERVWEFNISMVRGEDNEYWGDFFIELEGKFYMLFFICRG